MVIIGSLIIAPSISPNLPFSNSRFGLIVVILGSKIPFYIFEGDSYNAGH
jgi:hypothetical protein